MPYVTVVPAIRTIPGVEAFDYEIPPYADVRPGDILRVPFRLRSIPAMVIACSASSTYAEKAKTIKDPHALLRLGPASVHLLQDISERAFVSKPSVLASWVRAVPARAKPMLEKRVSSQPAISERRLWYLADRWNGPHGLIPTAKHAGGSTLILSPWQTRAERLAQEIEAPVLHAGLADGKAWTLVQGFIQGEIPHLVVTRIGAWLALCADAVLVDEPENDDYKQDELSPRVDARWVIERCASLCPSLSLISFATTPRLSSQDWRIAPEIIAPVSQDIWQRRGSSAIECLTARSEQAIQDAIEDGKNVIIVHGTTGERSRIACRDCGWTATCTSCGFPLARITGGALCRKCGRRSDLPLECASCHGTDLSRGYPGVERIASQCQTVFGPGVRVLSVSEWEDADVPPEMLVVLTDIASLAGSIEDIRRRERLLIAWRRFASRIASSQAIGIIQGKEGPLNDAFTWLTADGVTHAWMREFEERRLFHYPPAISFAKLLCDGPASVAQTLAEDLKGSLPEYWTINGPYPVLHRASTRSERHVIHVIAPKDTPVSILQNALNPYKNRAMIDLDPVAFFA